MKPFAPILLLAATLLPFATDAAEEYPSKTVTIIVPFTPGGSNDAIARYLADSLGKLWKQNVIVENKAGGGSSIGSAYVARSAPDGSKLLLVSSSYTTNAASRDDQGFDPLKDLKPVSMVARGQVAVVAGKRVPINSLADLAREAKAKPIFFGTAGVGSTQHFNGELLNEVMGIKMQPVAYRGGQESLLDLAAGRIDIVVGTIAGVLPAIEGGRATPIAVLGTTRSKALSNVPTAAEAGFANAVTQNYWAVFVPSATPDAVVAKINRDIRAVTHTPEGRKFLLKLDGEPTEMSAEDVTSYVRKEIDLWSKLAKKLNISAKSQ